ncbi:hypothetical protein SAMN05428977_102612 [Nitrosomonas sp. Nm166]|nr:hypothetical protein SAMN05428977_102612 [Nitrosomonas sp. Nm166]
MRHADNPVERYEHGSNDLTQQRQRRDVDDAAELTCGSQNQ